MNQRIQVGVIGSNSSSSSRELEDFAKLLGTKLIDEGYRIICGGMGGVMESVSKGAHKSSNYREGDTVGILPTGNKDDSNQFIDICIATGFGYARNQIIVLSSDVVIAIGGGAGTLSEISFAWQMSKPIICVDIGEGWSSKLAGASLDSRLKKPISRARNIEEVFSHLEELFCTKK